MIRQLRLKTKNYIWFFVVVLFIVTLNNMLLQRQGPSRAERTPSELHRKLNGYDFLGFQVVTTPTKPPPPAAKTHVAFLKVHKTGSTTAQNMFLRFGWTRNLTFVLPPNKNEFLYPNIISLRESLTTNNTLPQPVGKAFDILCNHVIYNKTIFRQFMPADTFYIGILREPYEHFKSILNYLRPAHVFKLKAKLPGSAFLKNPSAYEPKRSPRRTVTRNRMSVEFGFPDKIIAMNDKQQAREYIKKLDEDFGLVMIADFFEESVVLMRRYLNWSVKDVIYLDKNIAKKKNESSYVGPFDRQQYKKWAKIDYMLYEHFFRKLREQIRAEGCDYDDELLYFKEIRRVSSEFCGQKPLSTSAKLKILKSRWSEEFELTYTDCMDLLRGEINFIQDIRERQYGSRDI